MEEDRGGGGGMRCVSACKSHFSALMANEKM